MLKGGVGWGTQTKHTNLTDLSNINKSFSHVCKSCKSLCYNLGPGGVINQCAMVDVSATQTGQTSECSVEEYGVFIQKFVVSYEIKNSRL